jgi:hypothetical protein
MSKLRIKISGCLRSMAGAEEFCALRHLATAARHGIGVLDALTTAFQTSPGSPKPDNRAQRQSASPPEPESRPTCLVAQQERST